MKVLYIILTAAGVLGVSAMFMGWRPTSELIAVVAFNALVLAAAARWAQAERNVD